MVILGKARRVQDPSEAPRLNCNEGEHSWPRLVLKSSRGLLLRSAISSLGHAMDERYEELPDDLGDLLNFALGVVACRSLFETRDAAIEVCTVFPKLAQALRLKCGLRNDDFNSFYAKQILEHLGERFHPSLGIRPLVIARK